MSGGRFNYKQNDLAYELFSCGFNLTYGSEGHNWSKDARKYNPMEDREVSELIWDALCLIYSLDYYKSGDTCKDTYKEDLNWFKNKWLNRTSEMTKEAYRQDLQNLCDELKNEFSF